VSIPKNFHCWAALVASALFLGACGEAADPVSLVPDTPSLASTGPVLVECPTDTEESATGTVKATGGSIRLHNHELRLPSQAVATPQRFRVAAPASTYMELDVKADGHDTFEFKRASTITIDYSRCTRSNIDKAPLSVWQIDPVTKELIEYMGGVDDKANRTITFDTGHLSTFSIAH
jgi:hypothetical protein